MALTKDFREFIELLNQNNVRYLVIGGYAVAFYGHPRYTKDLDVWIECSMDNAERMMNVIRQFGMESLGFSPQDFANTANVVQIGVPPIRIDIMMSVSGLEFDAAYKNRTKTDYSGISIAFLSLEDLLANKRASGRKRDLADVEDLESE